MPQEKPRNRPRGAGSATTKAQGARFRKRPLQRQEKPKTQVKNRTWGTRKRNPRPTLKKRGWGTRNGTQEHSQE